MLNKLAVECYNIALARGDVNKILKHCATEVIEAQEAKSKLDEIYEVTGSREFLDEKSAEKHYAEELADVIICCMIAAEHYQLDLDHAIMEKIAINRERARQGK